MQFIKYYTGTIPAYAFMFFILLSMYSKTARIIHTTAIRNEPNNTEPKLYLTNHQYPRIIPKSPRLSVFVVKYQDATATIRTYWEAATKNAENQKNINRVPHIMYFYSSVHANV